MAGNISVPFCPQGTNSTQAVTVSLGVTAGSARVAILSANTASNQANYTVRISNSSTAPCWIEFGDSAVAAVQTTGMYIAGSAADLKFSLPAGATHVAGIGTAAGPVTIYVTPGSGGV